MILFDYASKTGPILFGSIILFVISCVAAIRITLWGYSIIKKVICRKNQTTIEKKSIIKRLILVVLAETIICIVLSAQLPGITYMGQNIYRQKSGDFQTISGDFTIEREYLNDSKFGRQYYCIFTVDGTTLCPDNIFQEETYEVLTSTASAVHIEYVESEKQSLHDDNGEFLWDSNITILKITTID